MAESSPPLRQYLRFLRRQAWLILLIPALAIEAAAVVVSRQDSVYRASMGIIVAQGGGGSQPEIGNRPLTQTMTNILESDVIAQRVIRDLGLPITSAKLQEKLHVSVRPDSSILNVSYDSTNKREAVRVLEETGKEFLALTRNTLGVTGSLDRPGPLLIIANVYDPAHLDPKAIAPTPARTIGFAAVLGLALGLIFAFARESLDDRIRSRREAEEWFGAPVIGTLPKGLRGKPPPFGDGASVSGDRRIEALQILRANLQFEAAGVSGPTLVVTSALEGEGKSTVVASLSMGLALAGQDVISVETDLRRPTLHRLLGAPPAAQGLVDVIEGRAKLEQTLQPIPLFHTTTNGNGTGGDGEQPAGKRKAAEGFQGRLRLLPAGETTVDPTTVLSAERVVGLVNELKGMASYVVFDSPALLSAGEAIPLAVSVDSVIVVGRQGYTTRARANAVRDMLRGLGARKIVVVLMDARETLRAAVD